MPVLSAKSNTKWSMFNYDHYVHTMLYVSITTTRILSSKLLSQTLGERQYLKIQATHNRRLRNEDFREKLKKKLWPGKLLELRTLLQALNTSRVFAAHSGSPALTVPEKSSSINNHLNGPSSFISLWMTSLFTLVPYYCFGTFQKNKLTGYSSLFEI